MYDGGITYQKGLLEIMPVFFDILTKEDKQFFKQTAEEMIKQEKQFITTKNNVWIQENIKFPVEYRRRINQKLLDILQIDKKENCFDILHKNKFF